MLCHELPMQRGRVTVILAQATHEVLASIVFPLMWVIILQTYSASSTIRIIPCQEG